MMEGAVAEYDRYGLVREPAGSALPGVAPTNAYPCADGRFVLIAGNGDSIFKRLMALVGRDDLGEDPALARNPGRVERMGVIDAAIADWTRRLTLAQALEALAEARVPAGKVFTVADMVDHEQFQAREMIQRVELPDGSALRVPGIVPKLSATPGHIASLGPGLGQHTDAVLAASGVDAATIAALRRAGVIAGG
jgi:formyl-CoA transferase